jgi:predicted aminopeptidase
MKRFILVFMLLVSLAVFQGCYLLKQGASLIRYYRDAEEIQTVLTRMDLEPDERSTLELVGEIRLFAISELNLKSNENYTRYKKVDKEYLVDVVSACEKTSFEPYLWHFPLFGAFPYKGFFRKEDALRQAKRLRKKGYDVFVRKAEAFSTLGFFKDPIFSFMTGYSEFDLASLIIHEQTHSTIYVKNRTEFNEQLATFIGREGALLFIGKKYGEDSEEYQTILDGLADQNQFQNLMRELYERLDALYQSDADEDEKIHKKQDIIGWFQMDLANRYTDHFTTDIYRKIADVPINNAVILSVMRYTADLSLFYRFYEMTGRDLSLMISELSVLHSRRKDPWAFMKNYIEKRAHTPCARGITCAQGSEGLAGALIQKRIDKQDG